MLSFRTGYVHKGEVEMDPYKISKHYMRGWLLLDLIASVPFDAISGEGTLKSGQKTVKFAKLLKLTKLLRLTRIIK